MVVTRVRLRDFRGYASADVALGPELTVVHGRNGAGKTNLLEGLYFGLAGRSGRPANEREVVRFGEAVARVEVEVAGDDGPHTLVVGFQPGEPKRLRADGAPVERLDVATRPLVSVFLPDRLELVKGAPALRRAHLDQVVAAAWPARAGTGHGPHRDDLALRRDGRELRSYGSQGEQRLALLALLLAEREALAEARGRIPLVLLDDVMSELDAERRGRLVERLGRGGQVVITTTDLAHVPGAGEAGLARVAVADGAVIQEAVAAGGGRRRALSPAR